MKICGHCGGELARRPKEAFWQFDKREYCSRRCRGLAENKRKSPDEFKARYRKIKTPDGRSMLEHRWVMEQHIRRRLDRSEQVHHRNHNRLDNRIENLELVTSKEHGQRHTVIPTTKACVVCGLTFEPHKTKRRRAKTCSPTCANTTRTKAYRDQQAAAALRDMLAAFAQKEEAA